MQRARPDIAFQKRSVHWLYHSPNVTNRCDFRLLGTAASRLLILTIGFNKLTVWKLTETTGLSLSCRVRLLPESDARRGTVSYIGPVPEIPGIGVWIGVTLDEPTGKNDGSVKGKRYFECGNNCGVFVRPERCEAGDFPALDLGDEDMEEL